MNLHRPTSSCAGHVASSNRSVHEFSNKIETDGQLRLYVADLQTAHAVLSNESGMLLFLVGQTVL